MEMLYTPLVIKLVFQCRTTKLAIERTEGYLDWAVLMRPNYRNMQASGVFSPEREVIECLRNSIAGYSRAVVVESRSYIVLRFKLRAS